MSALPWISRRSVAGTLLVSLACACARTDDTRELVDVRVRASTATLAPAHGATHGQRIGTGTGTSSASIGAQTEAQPPPADASTSAGGLRWDLPSGWTRAPDRSMRLATFVPDARPGCECYATILAGDGGGLAANVNRWRTQMGLSQATSTELAGLATHAVLGVQATLVELEGGTFVGMAGEQVQNAGVIGLVAELGGSTLFVKLTGPASDVRAERERFLAFCSSLRPVGAK